MSLFPDIAQRHHGPMTYLRWAFGLIFVALTLTPTFISGRGPFWRNLEGDAAQHEIGWFYYARDVWRFPLFAIGNYHQPEGANIALTDSIPLFAVPAKLLYRALLNASEMPPIYTGMWTALCFLLQVVVASRLLRTLGVTKPILLFAGIALLSYQSMLFIRFGGHSALLAHFLLLLALDFYFRARQSVLGRTGWIAMCILPSVALLVHPYLAAMTCAIVLTTLLDGFMRGRSSLAHSALGGACVMLLSGCVYVIGGYPDFQGHAGSGYGYFSMNLLSPVIPFPQTTSGQWLGTTIPSIEGLYQWEGGCYLGAGVLLLLLVGIGDIGNWWSAARRHAVLLAMLIGFLIFAMSNRVGFGSRELLHVPLPESVIGWMSSLRGSGRFTWVPVYVLACWLIVSSMRRFGARKASLLLAAAALLQIADVAPMQFGVRSQSGSTAQPSIDVARWTELVQNHSSVWQFPSFECGGLFGDGVPGDRFRELEIDWIAAQQDRPSNSAYLARFTKDCAREYLSARTRFGEPGVLYLYRSDDETGNMLQRAGFDLSHCGYLDDVAICSGNQDLSAYK